jgi:hypothetical protein
LTQVDGFRKTQTVSCINSLSLPTLSLSTIMPAYTHFPPQYRCLSAAQYSQTSYTQFKPPMSLFAVLTTALNPPTISLSTIFTVRQTFPHSNTVAAFPTSHTFSHDHAIAPLLRTFPKTSPQLTRPPQYDVTRTLPALSLQTALT